MSQMALSSMKGRTALDLLPYNPAERTGKNLRTGVRDYCLVLEIVRNAFHALEKQEYEKFDALVGENTCEVRAVWIALKAPKLLRSIKSIQERLELALEDMERIEAGIEKSMSKRNLTLIQLLETATVELDDDQLTMIQCYLLFASSVRTGKINAENQLFGTRETDPKQLLKMKAVAVSVNAISWLVSKAKKDLSLTSVKFVQETAIKLHNKTLFDRVSGKMVICPNNFLTAMPMFWAYKTLIIAAEQNRLPIVMIGRFSDGSVETLLFDAAPYRIKEPVREDLDRIAFMVQGYVQGTPDKRKWIETIQARTIVDVILAGAADHRQYFQENEDARVIALEDEEFTRYQALALKEGYAGKNPTTFFIQHVYASLVGRIDALRERIPISFVPRDIIHKLND